MQELVYAKKLYSMKYSTNNIHENIIYLVHVKKLYFQIYILYMLLYLYEIVLIYLDFQYKICIIIIKIINSQVNIIHVYKISTNKKFIKIE